MIELLVTVGVAGVTMASAVHFLSVNMHQMREHSYRLEAEQAVRSTLDAITRDLRLAGACLPNDGQFVALAGVNAPGGDSITIRTGLVRTNMSCILSTLSAGVAAGATTLPVISGSGFTGDMLGYVRHPNGSGEIKPISAADGTTVTFEAPMSQAYPLGSGVYSLDERIYALDKTNPALPLLTLTVNRGPAEAFAVGVQDLQVKYVLDRNCPTCDQVNMPVDTAEWRLVNSVLLTEQVETVGGGGPYDQVTVVASSMGKPRNLLP